MANLYRILVVDDDLELCQVIVDILKERGYDVNFVQTAEEGLEKGLSNTPDLFILDLEVPKMGGFVLCQNLRAHPKTKDIPVVFLTVRDSDFDKKTAMSLGANQYITKPFRRSVLLKEVENLLAAQKEDWVMPRLPSQLKDSAGDSAAKEVSKPLAPPTTQSASSLPPSAPSKPQAQSEAPSAPISELKKDETAQGPVKELKTFESFAGKKEEKPSKILAFKTWAFKSKKNKIISIGVSFSLLVGSTYGSFMLYKKFLGSKKDKSKTAESGELTEVSVNVMQAAPAPFQDILSAVGTVAGGSEIELRFQTEGNLRSLNFKEGDSVHSGQVIAQLDQTQVSIKLERAKSEYYRYEKLYALGGVSKDRLDEAKVQLDFAQSELSKTILRATQDGIFGDKGVEVGEFVTPQKKVGTLVSLHTVLVRIGVIEKEIDKIFPGQMVLATVETYPNVEFKGKVENISPLVQGQSKTLMVEARMPNTGKLLLPGMFARTRIIIYEKDNVIALPNDALEKTAEGYRIFIVGKENKAEVRSVEVSYVSLTHSVVASGLQAGEQVIIQRPQELKEGSPLKIVEVEKSVSKVEGGQEDGAQGHEETQEQPIH
ncbi:MAG: efflux RND transporter periplasmic adaptor subunit [Elusimicrobia bacterium]|nr:efflux RND transporter periplasmic adaptor subunit [Elusimicrobiota bacterium]